MNAQNNFHHHYTPSESEQGGGRTNDLHPDTVRLNHLLHMHHAVLAGRDKAKGTRVECIDFIYDANPDLSNLDALRLAIDNCKKASENFTKRVKS